MDNSIRRKLNHEIVMEELKASDLQLITEKECLEACQKVLPNIPISEHRAVWREVSLTQELG